MINKILIGTVILISIVLIALVGTILVRKQTRTVVSVVPTPSPFPTLNKVAPNTTAPVATAVADRRVATPFLSATPFVTPKDFPKSNIISVSDNAVKIPFTSVPIGFLATIKNETQLSVKLTLQSNGKEITQDIIPGGEYMFTSDKKGEVSFTVTYQNGQSQKGSYSIQ